MRWWWRTETVLTYRRDFRSVRYAFLVGNFSSQLIAHGWMFTLDKVALAFTVR
jgi:hypothetical protein